MMVKYKVQVPNNSAVQRTVLITALMASYGSVSVDDTFESKPTYMYLSSDSSGITL